MNFRKYTISEQAILTTLLYSDIFSFPLTKDELWKFLIAPEKISREDFDQALHVLTKQITVQDGYFCLKGKETSIAKRKQNAFEVERKMKRALWVTQKLSRIPSLLFVGISGGLAVGNVTKSDDIDLIIIVKENTLFMSRFLILSLLQILGMRRSRGQKYPANTICVNLLFDETALGWFTSHKDIYTAREIGQIIPVFERKETYQKFLSANSWIRDFLPNIQLSSLRKQGSSKKRDSRLHGNDNFGSKLLINPFTEYLSRQLQMSLMKRHQTNEIIENHILAFHPNDYRFKTLKQLSLKMRQFGLLTKI